MYTYIVADDESLIRRGTIKKLSPLSDQVTCVGEASNGLEAIRLIEEKHPDFVILDMQMPEMDGTTLLPYLAENYPSMPLIVISGYKDVDYLKSAISANAVDYLFKPFSKETLQECVRRAIDRIADNHQVRQLLEDSDEAREEARYALDLQYLTDLILGYNTGEAKITSRRLSFIAGSHSCLLVSFYYPKSRPAFHLQGWLDDNGFGDLALYISNKNLPQMEFLILLIPQLTDSGPRSRGIVEEILRALQNYLTEHDLPILAGISLPHEGLSELHTAFQESSGALDQQLLSRQTFGCYRYDRLYDPRQLNWHREDEFLFRIEAGMVEETRQMTRELFAWFINLPDCTLSDVKYYCYTLANQCRLIMNRYLSQNLNRDSGTMQNIVQHMFHVDELQDYYGQFFSNLAALLKENSIYNTEDMGEKIQIYIRHHYQKDLTQDFLASLFYLNRSYLSTLFKQKTGEKFIDYLNGVRIEKACELLTTTDLKMYQVAKMVGYDNTKYFFRIFKKKKGITPEQFRSNAR